MSGKIKNWDNLIAYMQNNPDSVLIKNHLLDMMPLVLFLNGKRTELHLREPLPFADERLEAKPHIIDDEVVFGVIEYRIVLRVMANDDTIEEPDRSDK